MQTFRQQAGPWHRRNKGRKRSGDAKSSNRSNNRSNNRGRSYNARRKNGRKKSGNARRSKGRSNHHNDRSHSDRSSGLTFASQRVASSHKIPRLPSTLEIC